ncbi:MAG: DUF2203 domain-containing protein [Chloroflexota bacterium]
MMPARYFTVQEANELLPELEPLVGELLERRARVVAMRKQLGDTLDDVQSDVGGPVQSQMVQDFMAIERLVHRIRSYGCILKDMNSGLLDFLSERDGREVYLCWRYGEPEVAHYHELHTGFSGRRPVE